MVRAPRSIKLFVVVAVMLAASLIPFVPAQAAVYAKTGSCWNSAGKHNVTVTWETSGGRSVAKSIAVTHSVPFSRSFVTAEVYAYQSILVYQNSLTTGSYTFTPNAGGYTSSGVWTRVWFSNNAGMGGGASRCNVDILD